MTIKMPKKTIGDKILGIFGKKRAFYISPDLYKTFGPYVYVKATRESFWKALVRSKKDPLGNGWTYLILSVLL